MGGGGGGGAGFDFTDNIAMFTNLATSNEGASAALTWEVPPLATTMFNGITGCSLAANQITLPAGTYQISWAIQAPAAGYVWSRMYDVTGAAVLGYGGQIYAEASLSIHDMFGSMRVTFGAENLIQFEKKAGLARADWGLGWNKSVSESTSSQTIEVLIRKEDANTEDHCSFMQVEAHAVNAGTATADTWMTRALDIYGTNGITGLSNSAGSITIPAGTYFYEGLQCGQSINGSIQSRLYDTTGSAVLGDYGQNGFDASRSSQSYGCGEFTVSVESVIRWQMMPSATQSTSGMGADKNWGTEIETYANLRLWKRA
jgi:hypothetical protein